MSLPEELKDGKIGRVPVWAVGVGIAAAILLFFWWRNRGKGDEGSDTGTADYSGGLVFDGSQDVSGLPPGSIGDWLDSNPLDAAYPVGLTPKGIPGPVTNIQWARLAFDHLVGLGNDPALVERALQKYISGQSLTDAERAVVNLAQTMFGAPPEGLILSPPTNTPPTLPNPPGNTGPLPPGTGTPRPTTRRFVIVARYRTPNPPWNSTLWGIAQRYNRSVDDLVKWNNIKNRNVVYTGQKIWVDPA